MAKRRRSKTLRRNKKRLRPSRLQSRRLSHETLEDRHLLTTWTVTTLADTIDASDGQVSLREAVDAARLDSPVGNAASGTSGDDIIQFAPSLFANGPATITLMTEPLDLDGTNTGFSMQANDGTDRNAGSLTILGPGRDLLAINGQNLGGSESVFTVEDTVNIKGLTIEASRGRGVSTRIKGSASNFEVQESYVTIEDSRITGNLGGGIEHLNGTLEVIGTIVDGNSTGTPVAVDNIGGGISVRRVRQSAEFALEFTTPEATIVDSIISNNTSALGGGIGNQGGRLLIQGSTIEKNETTSNLGGGGITSFGFVNIGNNSSANDFAPAKTVLLDSVVSENVNNGGGAGGGIRSLNSELTVSNSVIEKNEASRGGGISVIANDPSTNSDRVPSGFESATTIRGTSIVDNRSTDDGGGLDFDVEDVPGFLEITGTTIAGNMAMGSGGGLSMREVEDGTVVVSNSTLSGNRAAEAGGGISQASGDLTVTNTTITLNSADEDNSGNETGGGLHLSVPADFRMVNTIVAGNKMGTFDTSIDSDDIASISGVSATTSRHNLIGDPATAGGLTYDPDNSGNLVGDQFGNAWDVNRILFTNLADNLGGTTGVHALKVDSPAIDAGTSFVPTREGQATPSAKQLVSDQRGYPFLRADDAIGESGRFQFPVDIGAYEVQTRPVFTGEQLVVSTLVDESDGDYSEGDLSLREAIEIANLDTAPNTIRFRQSISGPGNSIVVSSPLLIQSDITISGPGSDFLQVRGSASQATRIFEIAPAVTASISGLTIANGRGTRISPNLVDFFDGIDYGIFKVSAIDGGAIFNVGETEIQDVAFVGNHNQDTEFGYGGAVFNVGTMEIRDSVFRDNSAGAGGAIANDRAEMVLSNVVVVENNAMQVGGGIYTAGTLAVSDSLISDNDAVIAGGGLYEDGNPTVNLFNLNFGLHSVVEIRRSEISHNTAGDGGGIAAYANLAIYDSTVSYNTANDSGGAQGGGIFSLPTNGDALILDRTTIAHNIADSNSSSAEGGGLFLQNGEDNSDTGESRLFVSNSTISNNTADGQTIARGGGVFVADGRSLSAGDTTIVDSTIALNNVTGAGSKAGSGLYVHDSTRLSNSIVADNTGATNQASMATGGDLHIVERSLIEGAIGGGSTSGTGQVVNADPQLEAALADNGGPTQTIALGPASPALDASERLGLLDQRGFPATEQLAINNGGLGDIGAYESSQISQQSFTTLNAENSQLDLLIGLGYDTGLPLRDDVGSGVVSTSIPSEPGFLGLEVDLDPFTLGPGIAQTFLGDFGGVATADVDARVGFEYGYFVDSGALDTFLDGVFSYRIDDSGDDIVIDTAATLTDGRLYTGGPSVGAYVDLVFEFNAAISGEACVFVCAGGSFDINVDESLSLLSINRQREDENGNPMVDNDTNRPILDGEVQIGGTDINELFGLQPSLPPGVDLFVDYLEEERVLQREQAINIAEGIGDTQEALDTLRESFDREKKATTKPAGKSPGVGKFVTVSAGAAEGDLLGAEVELGIGASAGGFGVGKKLGKLAVTVPKVELTGSGLDEDGRITASTDDFAVGSVEDANRQIAALSIDVAAIGPLGTYTAQLGPIDIEATTVSYNITPRLALAQDVSLQPFFDDTHGVEFVFSGFSGSLDVTTADGTIHTVTAGQSVNFVPGQSIIIDDSMMGTGTIDVLPSVEVGQRFTNDIGLDFDIQGMLEVLALKLNAFGEELLDIGPLYEDTHELASIDLGSIINKTFNLNTIPKVLDSFTIGGDAVAGDGATPGAAVVLTPGLAESFSADGPNTTSFFSVPLTDTEGVLHNEVRFETQLGQPRVSSIRPPYAGLTLELLNGDSVITSVEADIEGVDLGSNSTLTSGWDGLSWRLSGFENLMGGQAIFGVAFDSASNVDVTATVEGGGTLAAEGVDESRLLTAAKLRSFELQAGVGAVDNDLAFDIDGDGTISVTTDGTLVARYVDSINGGAAFAIDGAVAEGATRLTQGELEAYLRGLRATMGTLWYEPLDGETTGASGYSASEIAAFNEAALKGARNGGDSSNGNDPNSIVFSRLDADDSDGIDQTDALLILRQMSGLGLSVTSAPNLTDGLTSDLGERSNPEDIRDFISGRRGPRANSRFEDQVSGVPRGDASERFIDPNTNAGASPWNPIQANANPTIPLKSFVDGSATYTLDTFNVATSFQDVEVVTNSGNLLVRSGADGTPGRLVDVGPLLDEFGNGLLTEPLQTFTRDFDLVETDSTRQLGVDSEAPIFVNLPDAAGYELTLPAGLTFATLDIDSAVAGNVLLNHRGEAADFDVYLPGADLWLTISMDTPLDLASVPGLSSLPDRIELFPRDLSSPELIAAENEGGETDLDLVIGFTLDGTATSPDLAVTVLTDRSSSRNLAPLRIDSDEVTLKRSGAYLDAFPQFTSDAGLAYETEVISGEELIATFVESESGSRSLVLNPDRTVLGSSIAQNTITGLNGEITTDTFSVTVTDTLPVGTVQNPLDDLWIPAGTTQQTIDLSNIFDESVSSWAAVSSDPGVSTSLTGNQLTVSSATEAQATITLTATGSGNVLLGSDTFAVVFGESAAIRPLVVAPVPDTWVLQESVTSNGLVMFGTGVGPGGSALGNQVDDPHYEIISNPSLVALEDRTSVRGDGNVFVGPPGFDSVGRGLYVYRTTLDLSGFDHRTATVIGEWAVDDRKIDIRVNGVSNDFVSTSDVNLESFTLDDGFQPGVNTIDFYVDDSGGNTGLLVKNLMPTAAAVVEQAIDLAGRYSIATEFTQASLAAFGDTSSQPIEIVGRDGQTDTLILDGTGGPIYQGFAFNGGGELTGAGDIIRVDGAGVSIDTLNRDLLRNVSQVDLRGSGINSLLIDPGAISNSENGGDARLLVLRNADDQVMLDDGFGAVTRQETEGGITYDVYSGTSSFRTNVALGGTATQTSTLSEFGPDKAIDGDPGTFSHTLANDDNSSLTVDVGSLQELTEIVLHNRADCCQSRFRDITVEVLDGNDVVVFTSELLNPENSLLNPDTLTIDFVALFGAPVTGQKVRVSRTPDSDLSGLQLAEDPVFSLGGNLLTLAEVEIFSYETRPVELWLSTNAPAADPQASPISPPHTTSLLTLDAVADSATLPKQEVLLTPASINTSPGDAFDLDVSYRATDLSPGVPPAVLIEVHYDNAFLSYQGSTDLAAASGSGFIPSTTGNLEEFEAVPDGDLRTNRVVVLSWSSELGDWDSDASLETLLATLGFQAEAPGNTSIRITGLSSAGYELGTQTVDVDINPTFVVDNVLDENDGDFSAGDLSLREAIEMANADSGEATIQFDPGVFSTSQTILLQLGQLSVTSDVNILGPGADLLTIDGQDNSRVFAINDGDNNSDREVTLSGITITGGNTASGGGIFSREDLTIADTTITDNTASGLGGGIFARQGDLTILRSTISNNEGARGGGLATRVVLTGDTLIRDSTFSGNLATSRGGAIENYAGFVSIENSTITNNSATNSTPGVFTFGGNSSYIGTTIGSSIIAGNNGTDINGSNTASAGYNAIGSGASGPFTQPGDQFGVDPMLAPLADNGGPTMTHLPLPNSSPVINAGDPAVAGGTDQRGESRVVDGVVDIGAVETRVRTLGAVPEGMSTQPAFALQASEVAFYQFELDSDVTAADGGSLVIDTLGSVLGSGSFGDNDSEIGLYDEAGNLVATNDDIDVSTNRLSRLSFGDAGLSGDLAAGTYYLAIGAFDTSFGSTGFAVSSVSGFAGDLVVNFDLSTVQAIDADFNDDGNINGVDIDLLQANLVNGPADPGVYDLTGDGLVTIADRNEWLVQAGAANLASGNPYLLGDANLDGFVDGSDFNIWNSNKFQMENAWTRGDFNSDGFVDGSDFNFWNSNKFTSSDFVSSLIAGSSQSGLLPDARLPEAVHSLDIAFLDIDEIDEKQGRQRPSVSDRVFAEWL